MADRIYVAFGARVRGRREELEMTQAQLSESVGLSRASVANIEAGRQAVMLHQVIAFATALTVRPVELLPLAGPSAIDRDDLPDDVRQFVAETFSRPARKSRR